MKASSQKKSRVADRKPRRDSGPVIWRFDLGEWLSHAFRRRGLDLSWQAMSVILALLVIVWLVTGSYLVVVSQTMVAARRIQELRDRVAALQRANAILEQEIMELEAMDNLLGKAQEQGFGIPSRVEFVEP
ncbi:MAG: hypothetical protein JW900_06120 [Anaerolineae bacterium]|nr:hypothetical protein [Anaerolineae bacterium]